MKVLNFLQHKLTDAQLAELNDLGYDEIVSLAEWDRSLAEFVAQTPGDDKLIATVAYKLAESLFPPEKWLEDKNQTGFVNPFDAILLPGGSPAFMFAFARQVGLFQMSFTGDTFAGTGGFDYDVRATKFIFSHSVKVSVDQTQVDGSIRKVSVFQHEKFLVF